MKMNPQNPGLWKKIGTKTSARPQTAYKKDDLRNSTSENILNYPHNG